MGNITFVTRIIQKDGTTEVLSDSKAKEIVTKRIHEALTAMNYERKEIHT